MSLTTLASNRLNRRYSLMRLAGTGLTLSMVGVLATLASAFAGIESWPLMIPLFIAIAPLGMVLGNASAIAMSAVSARTTGLASSFLGLGQFALAGVAAALVGLGGESTPVPMAIIMLASGVIAIAGLVLIRLTRTAQREPVPAACGDIGGSLAGQGVTALAAGGARRSERAGPGPRRRGGNMRTTMKRPVAARVLSGAALVLTLTACSSGSGAEDSSGPEDTAEALAP